MVCLHSLLLFSYRVVSEIWRFSPRFTGHPVYVPSKFKASKPFKRLISLELFTILGKLLRGVLSRLSLALCRTPLLSLCPPNPGRRPRITDDNWKIKAQTRRRFSERRVVVRKLICSTCRQSATRHH